MRTKLACLFASCAFGLDHTHKFFGVFMVQTQRYRAPTFPTFKRLAGESAGIASKGGMGGLGQGEGGGGMSSPLKQRDTNSDGKLGPDEIPAALMQRLDADKDGFVSANELKVLRTP